MEEIDRLLKMSFGSSDPKKALEFSNAVHVYLIKAKKKEEDDKKERAEFNTREKKYLAEIVSLTDKNLELKEFFSIIAHDLRRPFNGFLGLSEVLKKEAQTITVKELQDIAEGMNKSAKNLFSLLENLIIWSKEGMTAKFENVSLIQIVEKVQNLYSESAEKKGINLGNEIPGSLNLLCDRNMVETIIRNLVSNAIKFCCKDDDIIIRAAEIGNMIKILITDTGVGMNSEMVEKLFYLGYDSGRPGTAKESSSGIGLKLCRKFVELHNGKIFVESTEGFGSNFYFFIPKNPADAIDIHDSQNQILVASN